PLQNIPPEHPPQLPEPQLFGPQSRPAQLGAHTQRPEPSQLCPPPQLPQLPPQPSDPHTRPAQLGAHTQCPEASQRCPAGQLPHTPPQPSGPQTRPRQRGTQASSSSMPMSLASASRSGTASGRPASMGSPASSEGWTSGETQRPCSPQVISCSS